MSKKLSDNQLKVLRVLHHTFGGELPITNIAVRAQLTFKRARVALTSKAMDDLVACSRTSGGGSQITTHYYALTDAGERAYQAANPRTEF